MRSASCGSGDLAFLGGDVDARWWLEAAEYVDLEAGVVEVREALL